MKQCLMIQTQDRKKLFTYEKNFPQLIEFSKIFNAEISTVQIPNEAEVLELEELAPALCEKKSQNTNFRIVQIKVKPKKKRRLMISRAKRIQTHIKKNLLKGKVLSLKDLKKKYDGLTTACLCSHFSKIRAILQDQGHEIAKVGGGKYKLVAKRT
jgi:hypothetical protein